MSFSWIPFYEELADKLLEYKNDRSALISKVKTMFNNIEHNLPKIEKDNDNINNIDPFTVFSLFNFGKLSVPNRIERCKGYKEVFDIKSDVPVDLDGIPIQNYSKFCFYEFSHKRKDDTCFDTLWDFFEIALKYADSDGSGVYETDFERLFDEVKRLPHIGPAKLSIALFHIRPRFYLSLDSNIKSIINDDAVDAKEYLQILNNVKDNISSYGANNIPELSAKAYEKSDSSSTKTAAKKKDASIEENHTEAKTLIMGDSKSNYDKNLILYGPPGTGKTYNSIIYAVAICDYRSYEDVKAENYYDVVIPRYRELCDAGRIAFTTFHQSYGYEDFIEGIKPFTTDDDNVGYRVEDGIFKKFCLDNGSLSYDFDKMWESLIEHAKENGGTIVVELATKTRELRWDEATEKFYDNDKMQYESVTYDEVKLIFNGTFDGNKRSGSKMQKWYNGKAIVDYMKTHFAKQSVPNKVFIIDEINRGNISKIFGELITLIEPSKRGGAREAMSVKLPYSGDDFTVPQNIYILGTMNTADRSIALMDTALRRRFKFKEMLPDTSGLGFEIDGVNIKSLLDRINERIELLYDREHTIGHSFFMSLKENNDISALADVFEKDIIPLLQEYFYGDYEKIRLVFANNDFITVKDVNDPVLIDVDIATKYEINKEKLKDPEEYKKIYS